MGSARAGAAGLSTTRRCRGDTIPVKDEYCCALQRLALTALVQIEFAYPHARVSDHSETALPSACITGLAGSFMPAQTRRNGGPFGAGDFRNRSARGQAHPTCALCRQSRLLLRDMECREDAGSRARA